MPASRPPAHPYPGTYKSLDQAARDGEIYELTCNACKRTVRYLAIDLINLVEGTWPIYQPIWRCRRHGTEYLVSSSRRPRPEEYGRLMIRRPSRVVRWRNEPLGEGG